MIVAASDDARSLKATEPPTRKESWREPRASGPGLRNPSRVMPQVLVKIAARCRLERISNRLSLRCFG
mgnify:CR=1 FL=1